MAGFYQVTLNGKYAGSDIKNILWYQQPTLWGSLLDYLGFVDALAAEVIENIWQGGTLTNSAYRMRELLSTAYRLESISIVGYNDVFVPFTSDPHITPVNEDGVYSASDANGPAPCCILRANLAPAFGPGIGLPTRGYLAIGPVGDAQVDGSGHFTDTWLERYQGLADALAEVITTESPSTTVYPIRVRLTRTAGVLTDLTYKNVSEFVAQPLMSFRRSRLPEA